MRFSEVYVVYAVYAVYGGLCGLVSPNLSFYWTKVKNSNVNFSSLDGLTIWKGGLWIQCETLSKTRLKSLINIWNVVDS